MRSRPAVAGGSCWGQLLAAVGQRGGQQRRQPPPPGVLGRHIGDQVLAQLDQHMGPARAQGVAVDRVAGLVARQAELEARAIMMADLAGRAEKAGLPRGRR